MEIDTLESEAVRKSGSNGTEKTEEEILQSAHDSRDPDYLIALLDKYCGEECNEEVLAVVGCRCNLDDLSREGYRKVKSRLQGILSMRAEVSRRKNGVGAVLLNKVFDTELYNSLALGTRINELKRESEFLKRKSEEAAASGKRWG